MDYRWTPRGREGALTAWQRRRAALLSAWRRAWRPRPSGPPSAPSSLPPTRAGRSPLDRSTRGR
eukprot:5279005-Pyramimonas_sp.AAC.1